MLNSKNVFKIKYSALKISLVATLAVWSFHCWTRDDVNHENKLFALKSWSITPLKFKNFNSPRQPVNKTVKVALYASVTKVFGNLSLKKIATFSGQLRVPAAPQSLLSVC